MGHPCNRCGEPVYNELGCKVPPLLTDPWLLLAEQLVEKDPPAVCMFFEKQCYDQGDFSGYFVLLRWLEMPARQRCEVLVKALKQEKGVSK